MVRRSAFTMIELIFAIVIIAISVLSLPMINQVVSKNIEGSIVQEAIFAASAELNQVVSYYWDENSMEGTATLSRVVWSTANDCNNSTKLRPGHIAQPKHRRCTGSNALNPTLEASFGPEGDLDDLDDIDQAPHVIFVNPGGTVEGTNSGYKKIYNSELDVSFAKFDPDYDPHNNNIKKITVTISEGTNPITQLTTFSSNIGEIDYYKRSY